MGTTTLYEYREKIRHLLRDDSIPSPTVDEAINLVVREVNEMGRFRFHEGVHTLNLTANTYEYAVPANVNEEKLFLYAPGNNTYQMEVPRRRELWAGSPMIPTSTGNTPTEWYRYADNWYIVPIPDATMAAHNISVYYDKDLATFFNDMDTIALPDRHVNVLVYGTTAILRPGLLIGAPEGQQKIENAYARAVRVMMEQELWRFSYIPRLRVGKRWSNCSSWGFNTKVR